VDHLLEGLKIVSTNLTGRELVNAIEDAIGVFEQQRHEAENEEEDNEDQDILKFFSGSVHLLWWTLSSSFKYQDSDLQYLISNAHTPVSGIDDFLCLQTFELSRDISEMLLHLLDEYERNELDEAFDEEIRDSIEIVREETRALLFNIADKSLIHQIERGCHLYSCMIASAHCVRDERTLQLWRQCYRIKVTEMYELIQTKLVPQTEHIMLIPFTSRNILFSTIRTQMENLLKEKIAADRRIFDASNDHTQIESDFKCPKCGSFRTRQYWLQMRSADEPMSCLWKCYACNKSDID
jgi:DNA-directed RNA polymerase subunit M/transcription elongation factor TFIIS